MDLISGYTLLAFVRSEDAGRVWTVLFRYQERLICLEYHINIIYNLLDFVRARLCTDSLLLKSSSPTLNTPLRD